MTTNLLPDLNMAKKILESTDSSLVAVRNSRIWRFRGQGIEPLYSLVMYHKADLTGAALADKVMGAAAAYLVLNTGIGAVYARTMSMRAKMLLDDKMIRVEAQQLVEVILNRAQSASCPMEILTANIQTPTAALEAIGEQLKKWTSG